MNLAIRDIRTGLFRFVLTSFGIGLMLLAAISMTGLYRGIVADALSTIDNADADLWVVQADTEGPFAEGSAIDRRVLDRTLAIPGVQSARQFTLLSQRFLIHGVSVRGSLQGLDYPVDTGEWILLKAGRALAAGRGEAIADETTGLHLGDSLSVSGVDCDVVGVAQNYLDYNGNPMIAVSVNDALDIQAHRPSESVYRARDAGRLMQASKAGNIAAVMLKLQPGADIEAVRAAINRWGDVIALTAGEERNAFLFGRLGRLRGQILMFTGILLIVTAVVIAVTIYTMTLEKLHEIALLKLIGARNRIIVAMIVQQAALLGVLGYLIAVIILPILIPLYPRKLVLMPNDYIGFAVIVLVLCMAGAAMGIWRAMQVNAREVLS